MKEGVGGWMRKEGEGKDEQWGGMGWQKEGTQ